MKLYIDSEFKCHTKPGEGLAEVETTAFDGRCKAFIEGCRFVPQGQTWTREDGVAFSGEMLSMWRDYDYLAAAQAGYEEVAAELQDMQEALNLLGVDANGEMV